ncbi:MAG: lytic transglycosylase domain-containing protein [Lysobacter sp.]|nr:lytic transglycosylase domain-containing protein [Lysobacter sp.]
MKFPLIAASAALCAALFAAPTATPRQQAATGARDASPGRAAPGAASTPILIGSAAELASARAAIQAAERGTPDDAPLPVSHPLAGWVEYAGLRRRIDTLPTAAAQDFLQRHRGDAVGETFRDQWLATLAKREDWPAFRAAWAPTVKSTALRCAELNARQALGQTDADWTADAQALWRATGKSLPNECDAPMAVLAARGGLPPALRWERIEKAAAEWQPAVMRAAARGLPVEEFALANDYAAFIDTPHDRALNWPKTPRSRLVASHGLARQAKASPASVDTQLPKFTQALGLDDAERGRALYQAALWTVASYGPGSASRLAAVPDVAYDDKLHEWRVREAIARSDWKGALAAIRKMGDTEPGRKMRRDSRWRYFEARLLEIDGDKANAAILFRDAATKPEFHGFLAADRIGAPYALCPIEPKPDHAAKSAVARDPAIQRAMQLYRIERGAWAEREWSEALSRFTPEQRILAVEIAQDNGWFDRGVFGLVNVGGKSYPDELRLYHLRFPLHHDAVIRREAAKHDIDPTWVAAEIRAESVFNPKARSHADARGLMQVLPSTGAGIAKRLGLPWRGGDSLYEPEFNIQLGTAYLRELEDKYGQTYVAIAAYNAGPAPVARWQSQRPGMDADFWIETISYKETRDYVARILAFSVIYDWRLNRAAMPITDRLAGRMVDTRKSFACPLPPDLPETPAAAQPAPATKPAPAPTRARGTPGRER